MLLDLAAALAQPPLPPLGARHDPLRIELQRHLLRPLGLGLGQLRVSVVTLKVVPGLTEELAPPLRRAQLLGQLIGARSPNSSSSASSVALVSARISRAICSKVRLTSGLQFPAILVPSIDTTPDLTSPAR